MNLNENISTEKNRKITEEKLGIRDTVYGKIDISVKTMDKIIIGLIVMLIVFFILGIMV